MTFIKMCKAFSRGLDLFLALAIVTFAKNVSVIVIDQNDAKQEKDLADMLKPDSAG